MILKDNGELESEGELEVDKSPLEYASEVEYPIEGDFLVTKRALSTQDK